MKKIITLFFVLIISVVFLYSNVDNVNAVIAKQAPISPSVQLKDPLGLSDSDVAPQLLIGRIINSALGVVGSIALLMFIYGGFVWMTAAGGSESVTKGKNILLWATIGLVVIFSSYALTSFVLKSILKQAS